MSLQLCTLNVNAEVDLQHSLPQVHLMVTLVHITIEEKEIIVWFTYEISLVGSLFRSVHDETGKRLI